jgi:hypothetical protein
MKAEEALARLAAEAKQIRKNAFNNQARVEFIAELYIIK